MPTDAAANPSVLFDSVACPASTTCVAVGQYDAVSNHRAKGIIDTLSGGTWSAITAPEPAGVTTPGGPMSIACPSIGTCVAVGQATDMSIGYEDVIYSLSGGTWNAIEAPLPADASPDTLPGINSVVCASDTACTAVGTYAGTAGTQAFIDTLSGGSWSTLTAPLGPNPATNPNATLNSVACPASNACVAVGQYTDTSGHVQGLIDTGSGSTWTAVVAPLGPNPATSPRADLRSVACPSSTACTAGGQYDSAPGTQGLIDTLSGGTWTAIAAPLPSGGSATPSAFIDSVACASASACAVVGEYVDMSSSSQGLIDTGSGSTWTAVTAPLGPSPSANPLVFLTSVACPSATTCVAAGGYDDAAGTQGLIDTLSGGTWTGMKAPLPADASSASTQGLDALTCASDTACIAAGSYEDTAANLQGLFESNALLPPPPPCGFAITTQSPLTSATHGVAYSTTLSGCGGTPPYKWKKVGKLPKGLKLNKATGVISGTPTKAGNYSFSVKMTDKAKPKHSTTKTFSITVS